MIDSRCLVIVDLETTGLDPTRDQILEAALLLVDNQLVVTAQLGSLFVKPHGAPRMNDVAREMHEKSGLIDDIIRYGQTVEAINDLILTWLRQHVPFGEVPMCGNSVHFDRAFLRAHMPAVEQHFHYRNVDVSSIRECAHRWTSLGDEAPALKDAHRAIDDCYDSLALLRFYKFRLFDVAS